MPDLLLEIGAEEMPHTAVLPALAQARQAIEAGLDRLRLAHGPVETYGTPRRLAVFVAELADQQPDREVEYKGPPAERAFTDDGQPTDAALGFARARGVGVEQLSVRETDNRAYVTATVMEEGRPAIEVLPDLLTETIASLSFPKTMRWADLDVRFVRPIRWIVAMLGVEVIPFEYAGVRTGRVSCGHRTLGAPTVKIKDAADYLGALEQASVLADHHSRRKTIQQQAREAAGVYNGTAMLRDDVVDENNFLVEWPHCVVGSFDERFLALPDDVIAMVMEKHQSYFPVAGESGALLARFIVVANSGEASSEMVRIGNEKVIAARLADAEFYISEDTRSTPEQALERLKRVTYLGNLGTLYDKTTRLQVVVNWLAERLGPDDDLLAVCERAALLSKTDQVSQMVGDTKLAGLQGSIGGHYALVAGEAPQVADAIAEQYMPVGADGELPATTAGALLSVADKLDNLASAFYIGEEPTGTKDPMGLRRQAYGLILVAVDRSLRFSLPDAIALNMGLLPDRPSTEEPVDVAEAAERVKQFVAGRIENYLEAAGVTYDVVRAVLGAGWTDAVEVIERARAVARIRSDDADFQHAVDTATRPANIFRPSDLPESAVVAPELFEFDIERTLWASIEEASAAVASAFAGHANYDAAWTALKALIAPIDEYFDTVMVNVDDQRLRANRLAVMRRLDRLYCRLADFREIVQ